MPTYSQDDFERIADAIGKDVADVLHYRNEFEAAATWYRLNVPPAKRQEGPTLELRNQRIKKSKGPSGLRKQRSNEVRTLFELRKKAKQVEGVARKLLLHLGVPRPSEAPDGPGDGELLTFLASYSGSSEEEVIGATARIGRLAELLEAIDAGETLKACAYKAAQEAVHFANLLPKGHQGNVAVIGWIADMMSLYEKITGRKARTSIIAPNRPGEGKASGPFIRFLTAAGAPLGIIHSPESRRGRIRDNQTGGRRRK
jgi:hypothetical protein